jgi:3-phosphoshikimate 1-carboxyvinyltransferase
MNAIVTPSRYPLKGRLRVPGDKSISHRALLLGALADGPSEVAGALLEGDCSATMECMRALGVDIQVHDFDPRHGMGRLTIQGQGLRGLRAPAGPLDCLRSGTTMRLLCGILAGQPFDSVLTGDPQLLKRPMRRVAEPLRLMGAVIRDTDGRAPLYITGRPLHGITYTLPVASAQVKSALLLAGLYADGDTHLHNPAPSRDHTERMLRAMGADIHEDGLRVRIRPAHHLSPLHIEVPGDLSSAAFLIAAGVLVPGSDIVIENVGLNPTRTGLLDALWAMGAQIEVLDQRTAGGEPVGDLRVRASELRGTLVAGDLIPRAIDELPILAVAATQAHGQTMIRDAAELRVKETDRIAAMTAQLRRLGARVEELPDGMVIEGPTPLRGAVVDSGGDHRVAMCMMVAGLIASGETVVQDAGCAADSYPGFMESLVALGADIRTSGG